MTLVSLHTNYIILTKSINNIIKQDYLLLRRVWKRSEEKWTKNLQRMEAGGGGIFLIDIESAI